MRVTADQEGHRCTKCGEYIKVGQEIVWSPAIAHLNVAADRHHVSCPEKKKKAAVAARQPRQDVDHDELFEVRKCSREPVPFDPAVKWTREHMNPCGKTVAVRRGERVPSQCPYCGADWVRGNPLEVGWAA